MADRPVGWRPSFKAGASFLKKLIIPNAAGNPAGVVDYEIWVDDTAGKLAFRIAGATILVPLPSEITEAGLNQEAAEEVVQAMFTGADMAAGDITWVYTDNGAGAGTIKGTIKNSAITYAKMQNISAAARLLGLPTGAGAGPPQELTGAQVLTILGALDAATLGGESKATIINSAVNTVLNGVGAAYDTLLELKAYIDTLDAADDATVVALTTAVGNRSRFYAGAIPNGATPQTVTHGLDLANMGDFNYKIFVSATGVIEEYEVTPIDADNVSVSDESGAAIPAGRRIFITAGA